MIFLYTFALSFEITTLKQVAKPIDNQYKQITNINKKSITNF